ncbi:hypothetical protein Pmani_006966 [Petrolisthes manimaculis]|uniref:Uncharacterized protein n=1 Tax=Petrolisthes manimaculis TaxID=1843537 RepID=A0AAE1UJ45_9EUCA|nr:hypothetical protein Pmani_006966 [Petrolisthes manimaculis]
MVVVVVVVVSGDKNSGGGGGGDSDGDRDSGGGGGGGDSDGGDRVVASSRVTQCLSNSGGGRTVRAVSRSLTLAAQPSHVPNLSHTDRIYPSNKGQSRDKPQWDMLIKSTDSSRRV